jgi:integrase
LEGFNIVENWLNTVSFSHSNSKATRAMYAVQLQKLLDFIHKTPNQIMADFEKMSERKFRLVYAQYLKSLIGDLQQKGYAPSSVTGTINTIRSFFKYSDLPLGFIPSGSNLIMFHNKDISRPEIQEVLRLSGIRDKAFFCMSVQSGLRPSSLASLKLKDVEGILQEQTPIPCKITVRQEATKGKYSEYFSFIGKESVVYIKDYLKTRTEALNPDKELTPDNCVELTPDSFLFTKFGSEDRVDPAVWTHIFQRIVKKLRARKILDFKTERKELAVTTKTKKPLRSFISRSEYRLYNLRKYFMKCAAQAGAEYVAFWMGHTSVLGVDIHYLNRDSEFHRALYKEKAMPFLQLETETPSETVKEIENLRQQLDEKAEQVKRLEEKMQSLQPLIEFTQSFESEKKLQQFMTLLKDSSQIVFPQAKTAMVKLNFSPEESELLKTVAKKQGVSEDSLIHEATEEEVKRLAEKYKVRIPEELSKKNIK